MRLSKTPMGMSKGGMDSSTSGLNHALLSLDYSSKLAQGEIIRTQIDSGLQREGQASDTIMKWSLVGMENRGEGGKPESYTLNLESCLVALITGCQIW